MKQSQGICVSAIITESRRKRPSLFFCKAKILSFVAICFFLIHFMFNWIGCFCRRVCFTLELLDPRLGGKNGGLLPFSR